MPSTPAEMQAPRLEYGVDSRAEHRNATAALLAVFLLVAGFEHFAGYLLGAYYVPMLRDMGTKLPAIGAIVVEFHTWIAFRYGWVPLWLGALGLPLLISRLHPNWPREANGVYVLVVLAALLMACMTFFVIALISPFVTIGRPI